jgi:hypothetical protein
MKAKAMKIPCVLGMVLSGRPEDAGLLTATWSLAPLLGAAPGACRMSRENFESLIKILAAGDKGKLQAMDHGETIQR